MPYCILNKVSSYTTSRGDCSNREDIMNCSNCGTKNSSDAQFCQKCGTALVKQCPQCETRNEHDAQFCKSCGNPLTQELENLQVTTSSGVEIQLHAADGSLEGERKPVTILFADIVGSTEIAEALDSEEWKEIVNEVHRRVSEAVDRYGGTVAQLLGDGVLAFFGAPVTNEDDPVRGVLAALEIQTGAEKLRGELEGYVDDFKMRIGINTGEVVIGEVGTDLHMEYLAIGDAVNVAARLESAAEPGSVFISARTARQLGEDFTLLDLGELELKGKSAPIHAFKVLDAGIAPTVRRGTMQHDIYYVGRESEIEDLRSAFENLCEGQGRFVALLGEAGIGKSRLFEESKVLDCQGDGGAQKDATSVPSIRWLEGRALSYGGSMPYWTITQLIYDDLGLSDGAPEMKIKVSLRKRMEELFPAGSEDWYPYIAHLLGFVNDALVQKRIPTLDGETVKYQTHIALTEYFRRVAQNQPTVLVLDDMHWADPSSLEVVSKLLPLTDREALIIVMVMRIDREHGSWDLKLDAETNYPHRYDEIQLSRLTGDQTEELISHLLGVDNLPDEIHDVLLSRGEGNPFYLEEVAHHLVERGLIVRVNGSWKMADELSEIGVPETLQGVLLARIDRLDEEIQRTLQMASVIGKRFPYWILESIVDIGPELNEHLTHLQRVDLIRETVRLPELGYSFKHSLTQEAAYNSLLHERRKEYHHRVGAALEEAFTDRAEEYLGILARHFESAGAYEEALTYLIRAGDKARIEEAHEEALDFYHRTLAIHQVLDDKSGAADTWLKISLIYLKEFDFNAASEAHVNAFNLRREVTETDDLIVDSVEMSPTHSKELKINISIASSRTLSLDPGKSFSSYDEQVIRDAFAGLVEMDVEMNILPHIAKSWEVSEDGRRYTFNLRDDVYWTDGKPVTAEDFAYAWLRNLSPDTESPSALLLDVIVGARAFSEGRSSDPDTVGLRAVDSYTFQVELEEPISFFMYLVAMSATFPVPRHVIEEHGDAWTDAANIVSNGAFQVQRYDQTGGLLVRNPGYFGDSFGNCQRFDWVLAHDEEVTIQNFLEDQIDVAFGVSVEAIPPSLPAGEINLNPNFLMVYCLALNPAFDPFKSRQVRHAFAQSLDRELLHQVSRELGEFKPLGGFIPARMPGHSPDIGYEYNLEEALRNQSEAGYPNGEGFPRITLEHSSWHPAEAKLIAEQWESNLGVQIELVEIDSHSLWSDPSATQMFLTGWIADFPDPHTFLRNSIHYDFIRHNGWEGLSRCDSLLKEALHLQNRLRRLEIYRQIDRILVEDEVLLIPISYFEGGRADLVKPWVRGWRRDPLTFFHPKNISIDPH